jgi:hypothetical protein
MVTELPLGRIVRENPSLIPGETNFGQALGFTYLVIEFWITRSLSLGTRELIQKKKLFHPRIEIGFSG